MGAENLRHLAIFVHDAARAVTPLDPELIKVGDFVGQRAERSRLIQSAVRPV